MDLEKVKFVACAFRVRLAKEHNILALDKDLHIWANERELWVSYVNDDFRAEVRVPVDVCLMRCFDDFEKAVSGCAYMKTTYHLRTDERPDSICVPLIMQN